MLLPATTNMAGHDFMTKVHKSRTYLLSRSPSSTFFINLIQFSTVEGSANMELLSKIDTQLGLAPFCLPFNHTESWQISEHFTAVQQINDFIVSNFIPQFSGQIFQEMPSFVAQGQIKCKEYTIDRYDCGPHALVDVVRRYDSVGKSVVVVDPAGLK